MVFSGVALPGMDGFQLGHEIGRLYPDLPVVLTTGDGEMLARNGLEGFELLAKPYSMEQLSGVLRKATGREPRKRAFAP
jgi:DNA-binding NtrC family response regulator